MKQKSILFGFFMVIFLAGSMTACGGSAGKGSGTTDIEKKIKSGKPLASKNGIEIREGYVQLLQQINPSLQAQLTTPAGKKRLIDNLLEQEVLYQASLKRGIPKLPEYQEKAALYERVIFAQGLLEEEVDKKSQEYYQSNKDKEFSQVQLSHILIRTEEPRPNAKDEKAKTGVTDAQALEKAQAAKKKLDEGVAWEEVVTEFSDDRLTKSKGGDLGKITREDRRAGRLEWQELIDQAFKMKQGEITGPIKAKDGYHIIKVTEAVTVAPYEEVENRIQFKLRGPIKKEVLAEISSGEIKYLDEELKKIAEEQPGAPGAMPGLPTAAPTSPGAKPMVLPQKQGETPAKAPVKTEPKKSS